MDIPVAPNVVVMSLIPGRIRRGQSMREGLEYAEYSQKTWKWWCDRNGVAFVVLGKPALPPEIPPSIQRWAHVGTVLDRFPGAKVAFVDADTMIRWDAPDFFELFTGDFSARLGGGRQWVEQSIRAHQHFFPGVDLPLSAYFNVGMVLFTGAARAMFQTFVDLMVSRWPEFAAVQAVEDVGTDQTPLNYIARAWGDVQPLAPEWNWLHCPRFFQSNPWAFMGQAYVWHFNGVYGTRRAVMREVWGRVQHHYTVSIDT